MVKHIFGPSSGFTLDDLPDLTDEDGVTIPFTVLNGLDEGIYRFKISIVEIDGDPLVTSKNSPSKYIPTYRGLARLYFVIGFPSGWR